VAGEGIVKLAAAVSSDRGAWAIDVVPISRVGINNDSQPIAACLRVIFVPATRQTRSDIRARGGVAYVPISTKFCRAAK
jgi:hypothetical protein